MKKIGLLLLIFLVVSGCSLEKSELDKFKNYLIKNNDFKCNQSVCNYVENIGSFMGLSYTFDFNSNIFSQEKKTMSAGIMSSNSECKYDWINNFGTCDSNLLGLRVVATYNFETFDFTCNSNYDDQEYNNIECNNLLEILKSQRQYFDDIIASSKTTYFEQNM